MSKGRRAFEAAIARQNPTTFEAKKRLKVLARDPALKYSPDQERASNGEFGAGSGDAGHTGASAGAGLVRNPDGSRSRDVSNTRNIDNKPIRVTGTSEGDLPEHHTGPDGHSGEVLYHGAWAGVKGGYRCDDCGQRYSLVAPRGYQRPSGSLYD